MSPGPRAERELWESVIAQASQDLARFHRKGIFFDLGDDQAVARLGMHAGAKAHLGVSTLPCLATGALIDLSPRFRARFRLRDTMPTHLLTSRPAPLSKQSRTGRVVSRTPYIYISVCWSSSQMENEFFV